MGDLINRTSLAEHKFPGNECNGLGEGHAYRQGWNDAIDAIIDNAPSAEPEQHWIPVTERLPEYGAEVLTINTDGDYEINHIIDEEDAEWFYDGAIAWMPLPGPYKGGEEDG